MNIFSISSGYGLLWAGRDATLSLATMSLKKEDSGKLEWKLEDLSDQHKGALWGWLKHFRKKYKMMGKLDVYRGWDFSILKPEEEEEETGKMEESGN